MLLCVIITRCVKEAQAVRALQGYVNVVRLAPEAAGEPMRGPRSRAPQATQVAFAAVSRGVMVFEKFIRYPALAVGLMVFEKFIRYTGPAVGLKPSAMECEARLRGLDRIMYSKTISPRLGKAKPAYAGYIGVIVQRPLRPRRGRSTGR